MITKPNFQIPISLQSDGVNQLYILNFNYFIIHSLKYQSYATLGSNDSGIVIIAHLILREGIILKNYHYCC